MRYQPPGAKTWPEGRIHVVKAGRMRPFLHTVGAGRPYPLSAGLWLALPVTSLVRQREK